MVACALDGEMPPQNISNGIKQGSALSPILFSIYNKEGCLVGNMFFGCIVYADDVELLVPYVRGL